MDVEISCHLRQCLIETRLTRLPQIFSSGLCFYDFLLRSQHEQPQHKPFLPRKYLFVYYLPFFFLASQNCSK